MVNSRAQTVKVKSYAGYRAEERPTSFVLGRRKITIEKIIAQWREENQDCFQVASTGGNLYLLRYVRTSDLWTAEKLPEQRAGGLTHE